MTVNVRVVLNALIDLFCVIILESLHSDYYHKFVVYKYGLKQKWKLDIWKNQM